MVGSRPTAGALLREARDSAGLSQVQLAERAGVTQSVLSAYETGRRQPSLPTLVRLIEATGCELDVEVRRPRTRMQRLGGPIGSAVQRRRGQLLSAAAQHGFSNLRVFGSVARGDDDADSDVDLLVEAPAGIGLLGLARFQRDAEKILGTSVDVVIAGELKPGVAERIHSQVIPL
jgi:predicted nucleotidyltransferase/DNA-binding XRE family transcriptional regulator